MKILLPNSGKLLGNVQQTSQECFHGTIHQSLAKASGIRIPHTPREPGRNGKPYRCTATWKVNCILYFNSHIYGLACKRVFAEEQWQNKSWHRRKSKKKESETKTQTSPDCKSLKASLLLKHTTTHTERWGKKGEIIIEIICTLCATQRATGRRSPEHPLLDSISIWKQG